MAAGLRNFVLEQGGYFAPVLTWKDASLRLIDLTGWTAQLIVFAADLAATPLLTITSSNGIALGGAAGTIVPTITTAQIATFPLGSFSYILVLTDPTGTVPKPLLKGRMQVVGKGSE